jgi:ABC-2 type transport system permease protein
MPLFHQIFAQGMPYTHFLYGFLKLYQMGAPAADILPEVGRLSIFIILSAAVTLFALRYHTGKITTLAAIEKRSVVP